MTLDFSSLENVTNYTTTATSTDISGSVTNKPVDDDQWKTTIAYAIPVSFVVIVLIVLVIVGIRRRNSMLSKWNCFRRMKTTYPRFYTNTGLRRDSEFDSYSDNDIQPSSLRKSNSSQVFQLATVF